MFGKLYYFNKKHFNTIAHDVSEHNMVESHVTEQQKESLITAVV